MENQRKSSKVSKRDGFEASKFVAIRGVKPEGEQAFKVYSGESYLGGKLTVADNQETKLGGKLEVKGTATLKKGLIVSGDITTLEQGLTVSGGQTTLKGHLTLGEEGNRTDQLAVHGNVNVYEKLVVSEEAHFGNGLNVNYGRTTLQGHLTVGEEARYTGQLTVHGPTTLEGNLTVGDKDKRPGQLTVHGPTTLNKGLIVKGILTTLEQGLTVQGTLTTLEQGLTVQGVLTTLEQGLTVQGVLTTLEQGLTVQGVLTTLEQGLTVKGALTTLEQGLTVVGTVRGTSFEGDGIIPKGGIIMWSGSLDKIPLGWALCDGKTHNGVKTPCLLNRFVVAAGADYVVGGRGGEKEVKLEIPQIPSHHHTVKPFKNGKHKHDFIQAGQDMPKKRLESSSKSGSDLGYLELADSDGDKKKQKYIYVREEGSDHTHDITIEHTGGSGVHENRPPYYALAFIMKI